MSSLSGKTAIVTGASRGIGRAIAIELASQGANIVVDFVKHDALAAEVCRLVSTLGVQSMAIQADVSEVAQVEDMIRQAFERFGDIEILVNNAGITHDRTIGKMSMDEWMRVLQVDLTGVYICTKVLVDRMKDKGWGRIINIASIVGQRGNFGQANYAAAKAGVIGFTKTAAIELARYGITVNAVCPGFIETDLLMSVPADMQEQIRAKIPLKRFGTPEEVAKLVRFLACEGDYVTGQCFNINGGFHM